MVNYNIFSFNSANRWTLVIEHALVDNFAEWGKNIKIFPELNPSKLPAITILFLFYTQATLAVTVASLKIMLSKKLVSVYFLT